ncbi:MAG: threonine synthase, partial [Planctomycetes bacterium]|nr:threonine synthase [Planctomycetota bacterium]
QGKIPKDESIVISVTGNGLKTQEAVLNKLEVPRIINPSLAEFDAIMDEKMAAVH